MPLIRDYIAEHERAINLGGDAVRAIDCGELAKAAGLLDAMSAELRPHWRAEENGLFAVLGRDELYAEHIGPLVCESVMSVENHAVATSQIAQTTLRSVVGRADLDTLLAHRADLNEDLATSIAAMTESWGVKVEIVEIKDVSVPTTTPPSSFRCRSTSSAPSSTRSVAQGRPASTARHP